MTATRHSLFQTGIFQLHSGATSLWKIECDALTDEDWATLALLVTENVAPFGRVEGVLRGGLPLAAALERSARYSSIDRLLIVDDVWTTGGSMEAHRAGRDAIGAVVFARGPVAPWVTPLFTMPRPPVGYVPQTRLAEWRSEFTTDTAGGDV